MRNYSIQVPGYHYTGIDGWPAIEQMQWNRSCRAYGEFFAALMQPNRFDKTSSAGFSLPLGITWMIESFPKDWDLIANVIPDVDPNVRYTDEQFKDLRVHKLLVQSGRYLSEVMADKSLSDFFIVQVFNTSYTCQPESCMALALGANPDMTGIGIMISYYIEAGLATLFLIFFTVQRFKQWAKKKAIRAGKPHRAETFSKPVARRVMDAFRGTLESFLLAAILLAVAMLVAGIFVIAENIEDRYKGADEHEMINGASYYDVPLSVLACAFAVFPVLAAYSVLRHPGQGESGAHKKWLTRACLIVIWLLGIAVVYMAPLGDPDFNPTPKEDQANREAMERSGLKDDLWSWCDHRGGNAYRNALKAAMGLVVAAPLVWSLLFLFLHTGFLIPGIAGSKKLRIWLPWCRLAMGWICLAFTWGVLAYLQWLRQKLRDATGRLGDDGKWGFGQILALSVWVPVVFEFIYILLWGLQDSLSGSLPPEYKAVLRMDHPSPEPQNTHGGFGYVGAGQNMDTEHKPHGGSDGGLHMSSKNLPGGYTSVVSTTPALDSFSPPSTMYDPYQGIAPTAGRPQSFQAPAATAQHASGLQSPPQTHGAFYPQDPMLPTYYPSPPPAQYQQAPQPVSPPPQMTPEQMQYLQAVMQQQQPQFRHPPQ
ncbi:hypothetical protein GGTG_06409 [Gaeumannomyces tritici R3-111a-1]|uniref:Uncharacterized protein n=1 Tax=Gaeumannomyces tritici (strain R3-111a-1) TaxID=644352 RepID=J3NYQ7_GAET3|nr:hypothetical protein GGTG_06409 [Gaeumannomyces tritici R3-111a-1]EJT76490.1 hypothetical protein GGTG_06409 [Gaeumannomyces tritici R3-111a-1]